MLARTIFWTAAVCALAGGAAHGADRTPGAFCELTPCLTGPFDRRKLSHDERVGRVVCKSGTEVGFDLQRHLAFCTTAREITLDGVAVAAGAYTLFHPNGRIYQTHLAAPRLFPLAGGRTVSCAAELIALAADGRLRTCQLAAPLRGEVAARVGAGISFHPDGRVAGATIDRAVTAHGVTFRAGTQLAWDPTGAVVGGWLSEPARIGGLSIASDFALFSDGKLRDVQLDAAAQVEGHDFPHGARLEFRADGTLERARYVEKSGFMIHGEAWRDTATVEYDAAGRITSSRSEHWQSEVAHRPTPSGIAPW